MKLKIKLSEEVEKKPTVELYIDTVRVQYTVYACTWSLMAAILTTPVGSMRRSTDSEVTLSEGGVPSISPPSLTNTLRKSLHDGKSLESSGWAWLAIMEGSSTDTSLSAFSCAHFLDHFFP